MKRYHMMCVISIMALAVTGIHAQIIAADPNVRVHPRDTVTQVETSIAVDPTNPNRQLVGTMILAFQTKTVSLSALSL